MLLQVILEGIGLGVLLISVCAIGIRKGAVGMVHLYSPEVQNRCVTLGLTTHERIKRNALLFKAVCVPGYIAYVLVCVYALNGARGFLAGFWQWHGSLRRTWRFTCPPRRALSTTAPAGLCLTWA